MRHAHDTASNAMHNSIIQMSSMHDMHLTAGNRVPKYQRIFFPSRCRTVSFGNWAEQMGTQNPEIVIFRWSRHWNDPVTLRDQQTQKQIQEDALALLRQHLEPLALLLLSHALCLHVMCPEWSISKLCHRQSSGQPFFFLKRDTRSTLSRKVRYNKLCPSVALRPFSRVG